MKDESLHSDGAHIAEENMTNSEESNPTYTEKIMMCKEELEDLLSEEEIKAIESAENEDDIRDILRVAGIDIDDIYNKKENLPQ